MAIVVQEKADSRGMSIGDRDHAILRYTIIGSNDDVAVYVALGEESPEVHRGLIKQYIHAEPLGGESGQEVWMGEAHYGRIQKNRPTGVATGGDGVQFDTSGGTQHITHSLATINAYAPEGETAPDNKGAIGVTRDSVEGVDITVPVYNFSETHTFTKTKMSDYYKGLLFSMTGTVNSFVFRWFDIGEVLFLGASGALRDQSSWEITFRFSASPNVSGLTIGNISGIAKKGWEYMWVRYVDKPDNVSKTMVKEPEGVYIEQVYDYSDFYSLNIG